ncbi:hypothetical protein [Chryseobacterium sp. M5A1_1a]
MDIKLIDKVIGYLSIPLIAKQESKIVRDYYLMSGYKNDISRNLEMLQMKHNNMAIIHYDPNNPFSCNNSLPLMDNQPQKSPFINNFLYLPFKP